MREDTDAVTISFPMKLRSIGSLAVVSFVLLRDVSGQDFQNLDFESANLSPIPLGQFGGFVPITNALSGWTGYLGATQVTQVLQDNLTLGSGSIDILGPDWAFGGSSVIDGQYSVELQPGLNNTPSAFAATIAQIGMIPITAKSLQFKKAPTEDPFSVTIGGQAISMIPLQNSSTYILYGGDISIFAGLTEELRMSALPGTFGFSLDDIVFSPSSVPEPNTLGLIALGALLFSLRRSK